MLLIFPIMIQNLHSHSNYQHIQLYFEFDIIMLNDILLYLLLNLIHFNIITLLIILFLN